jgi:glycine betaine catabolism A
MSPTIIEQFRTVLQHTRRDFPQALTLPGAAYCSPEIFAMEQRALFGRSWLCVGHVAQWPNPGDFSALEVAGDSVLLLRAEDGILRAHYNVCRHRGSRLVLEARGEGLTRLLCPYHAWSYQSDGSLQQAPQMPAGFSKQDHGLVPVRIEVFEGFVFLNLGAWRADRI